LGNFDLSKKAVRIGKARWRRDDTGENVGENNNKSVHQQMQVRSGVQK
jgi:hypothetical protein